MNSAKRVILLLLMLQKILMKWQKLLSSVIWMGKMLFVAYTLFMDETIRI
ncbi:hypothetical protein IX330_002876 [Bacteroides pyogenes]|nr:hypothetical protein [Bacteroides pyogenes]MBR8726703.1 hypothetical protein [Bacteroides pyogenes]MBR8740115.1 hypothetical protein [Bacteroides pyogenes]MBR8755872.1 hypothetical protein [Bacteroides pyogenes]MBR8794085.1 hypothetical protein [Bacteroides pyogenes]